MVEKYFNSQVNHLLKRICQIIFKKIETDLLVSRWGLKFIFKQNRNTNL